MNWLFFINNMTLITLVITMVVLTVAVAAETFWPRRELQMPLTWRWGNNLVLALITWYSAHLVSYVVMMDFALWTQEHQFGLFHQFEVGLLIQLAALLVISQFMSYLTHVAFHKVPWLWPLHAVHHSDVDVDVSTSYRHHPLEPLVFLPVVAPIIILLGIGVWTTVAFAAIRIGITVFCHSNIRLPESVDKVLRKVIVTPDFHRVHHSRELPYTNSNYGSLVPWFDYLFGTARLRDFDSHENFDLGLDEGRSLDDNRVDRLVLKLIKPAG